MAHLTIIPAIFYDIYIGVRPLDWILITYLFLKLNNVNIKVKMIYPFLISLVLLYFINNFIFLMFGSFCLLLLHSHYDKRSYLKDLNTAIWVFVILFYIDYIFLQAFHLDLKNTIGMKNENYEAAFTRYSGILSEASNVGTVTFMLVFPYVINVRVSDATIIKCIVWVLPGFLSLSITSQIFSLMWLSYALFLWISNSNRAKYLIPILVGGIIFTITNNIDYLDQRYIKRVSDFANFLTVANQQKVVDGSMADRYSGSLTGRNFAGSLQLFGTSAPSGYRSVFGILFQSFNYISLLILMVMTMVFQFTVGFRGVFWFGCSLLLPSQFLTTILFYVSLYGVLRKGDR